MYKKQCVFYTPESKGVLHYLLAFQNGEFIFDLCQNRNLFGYVVRLSYVIPLA